jgi:uncharacterized protein (TIGR03000 family)
MLLLAGTALIATAALSQAQHGGGHAGGGHFGGGSHFGGGHYGGAHYGGAHYGGHYGGYRYGGGYGGYHHAYPYSGYGYHHYRPYHRSYGYYPYSGYYGSYYPYYSGYGSDYPYYGYYYDNYPDVGGGSDYGSAYTGDTLPEYSYGALADSSARATAPVDSTSHVTVNVPPDARVWFDGTLTQAEGPIRQFDSPALQPGTRYTYVVRASWKEDDHEVTQTQQIEVSAGAHINVVFPLPPRNTRGQSTATQLSSPW